MANQSASFEEQLGHLQEIVTKLQQGNVSLSDSIDLFKEGMTISNGLKKQLNDAEATLAKMMDENDKLHPAEEKGEDVSNNGINNQGFQSQFLNEDHF
jgi:exodeoxyribonuclease VII small subunit